MTGTTVTLYPHWHKQIQYVMNQHLSTSISGKPILENLVGEGWGEGSRSLDGPQPLTRIASRCDPTSPTRGEVEATRVRH
jgi:hypothetical protein